jgi:hypothetical protein
MTEPRFEKRDYDCRFFFSFSETNDSGGCGTRTTLYYFPCLVVGNIMVACWSQNKRQVGRWIVGQNRRSTTTNSRVSRVSHSRFARGNEKEAIEPLRLAKPSFHQASQIRYDPSRLVANPITKCPGTVPESGIAMLTWSE